LAARRDGKYCRTNRYGPQVEVIRGSQPVLNRGILLGDIALESNEDQSRFGDPCFTVHLVARGGRLFIIVETTTEHGLSWVVRTRTAQMGNIGYHRQPCRAQCLNIGGSSWCCPVSGAPEPSVLPITASWAGRSNSSQSSMFIAIRRITIAVPFSIHG